MISPTPHITEINTLNRTSLSDAFREAFHDALAGRGNLDPEVYEVEGFCERKFRLFLNNLTRQLNGDARYLEVGIFKGATLCPVIAGNSVAATAIDNWSWDKQGAVAQTFYQNLAKFKTSASTVSVLEADFRNIKIKELGDFNIYLYDGNHTENDQYDGISWALPALTSTAIILVDDWNWLAPREGTLNAVRDSGAHRLYDRIAHFFRQSDSGTRLRWQRLAQWVFWSGAEPSLTISVAE